MDPLLKKRLSGESRIIKSGQCCSNVLLATQSLKFPSVSDPVDKILIHVGDHRNICIVTSYDIPLDVLKTLDRNFVKYDILSNISTREKSYDNVFILDCIPWCLHLAEIQSCADSLYVWTGADFTLWSSRARSKRWAAVQSLFSVRNFGIVIQTAGDEDSQLASTLSWLLRTKGYAAYTLSSGKISPTKLGNFPDLDAFVVIGCLREVFTPKSRYFWPVVSPFELLCHLGLCDFWSDFYETNLRSLIIISEGFLKNEKNEIFDLQTTGNSQLATRYLLSKTYQGVPLNVTVDSECAVIFEGLSGIPRQYS